MKKINLLIVLLLTVLTVLAQDKINDSKYHNWYNKSAKIDKVYGAEVDRAYNEFLKNKKSTTVIVAVIDGGIDINHEDLKENIWTNEDEIPNNGIDDDKNGYIDDIHGWNFLGNVNGDNICYENLEITRIYRAYKDKYNQVEKSDIPENELQTYELYTKAKELYYKNLSDAKKDLDWINNFEQSYYDSYEYVKEYLGKDTLVANDLENINSEDKNLKIQAEFLHMLFSEGFNPDMFDEMKSYSNEEIDYHLNLEFNPRKEIIGDDPNDIEQYYGNNNVFGPEADHGTFVSGIIGAVRNNEIGINGIAENVKIIALKVVPNGDERDKDVAKAIRYAVDNGAKIINMSFGKELSPKKYLVDEAVKYAEAKGVLLVHAAGNDGYNIDKVDQYPTKLIDKSYTVNNWLEVGASSMNLDLHFAADFTNYGMLVDLFAPGVDIKSLAPNNTYDVGDGTSFSSPVVSGVAALILSYYPEFSAKEIKEIILKSAVQYPRVKTYKPGDYSKKPKKTKFKKLSQTAGLVNAYEAIKLAEQLSNQ